MSDITILPLFFTTEPAGALSESVVYSCTLQTSRQSVLWRWIAWNNSPMRCILHFKHHHSKCPAVFARGVDGKIFSIPFHTTTLAHISVLEIQWFSTPVRPYHPGFPNSGWRKPARAPAGLHTMRLKSQVTQSLPLLWRTGLICWDFDK